MQAAEAAQVLVTQVTLRMLRDSNSYKGLLGKRILSYPSPNSPPQRQPPLPLLVDPLVFASKSLSKMLTPYALMSSLLGVICCFPCMKSQVVALLSYSLYTFPTFPHLLDAF